VQASLAITLDHIIISVYGPEGPITSARPTGSPGVNSWRISELEKLAREARHGLAPRALLEELQHIESTPPLFSRAMVVGAVGAASSAFAVLNGSPAFEAVAGGLGASLGQIVRSALLSRHSNQYGAAAASALVASSTYVVAASVSPRLGLGDLDHPAGFISSVLFLVPGFPLMAALLDLLRFQTLAALTRLAYGVTIFLAATFGLSVIIGVANVSISPPPPTELSYSVQLLTRAAASFVAASGFAVLFNSSARTIIVVGLIAAAANELRLVLHDSGMMLAPATYLGSLSITTVVSLAKSYMPAPRLAIAVPAIIIMVPGVYAFQAIAWFNRGQMLDALQAAASCSFILGAIAMGVASVQFFDRTPAYRGPRL
jgi:uncharacterized membrane protein YjjP (DUF1212 family)